MVFGRWLMQALSRPESSRSNSNPESLLAEASVLDQDGEWDEAIALFRRVEAGWPEEHGSYAANSIAAIEAKIALGEALLCRECGEPLRDSVCRVCGAERNS